MTTEGQMRALTELVHQCRPAWDREGILAAIRAARTTGRTFRIIAHTAVDAAFDPDANTPGVIKLRQRDQARKDTSSPADKRLCNQCHQIHTPDQANCNRPTSNPTSHAAAARQALKASSE
jgi:hypothetical protein